jgi:hypothetical protein
VASSSRETYMSHRERAWVIVLTERALFPQSTEALRAREYGRLPITRHQCGTTCHPAHGGAQPLAYGCDSIVHHLHGSRVPSQQGAIMGSENVGTAPRRESAHIAIAADLLDQMIRELQSLERTYPTLQVAMATAARELHETLQALHILIQEIAVIDDPMRLAKHTSSAKSVISQLAWEVERLAIHVDRAGHFLWPGPTTIGLI